MSDDRGLTQAELFDVFSNARRRQTVRFLDQQGGSCQLGPLVEQVAAWENDTTVEEVTRTERRRVYISLYQTHLPMLADHELVEWDPDTHAIELLADGTSFEPYLADPTSMDLPWHVVYLGLSLLGAGLMLLATVSVSPLSAVPVLAVSAMLVVVVLGVATVQYATRTRRMVPSVRG